MPESIATALGMGVFLLLIGFFVVNICFPVQWHTKGVLFATSFLLIPAFFGLVVLVIGYPTLLILLLIIAFAGHGGYKKRK